MWCTDYSSRRQSFNPVVIPNLKLQLPACIGNRYFSSCCKTANPSMLGSLWLSNCSKTTTPSMHWQPLILQALQSYDSQQALAAFWLSICCKTTTPILFGTLGVVVLQ